jgi:hypothetical protein
MGHLTAVKRLLGPGFYDSRLGKTNLWAANEVTLQQQFYDYTTALYNTNLVSKGAGFLGQGISPNNPFQNDKLTSFLEPSYQWSLLRSNFFNSLEKNVLTSSTSLSAQNSLVNKSLSRGSTKMHLDTLSTNLLKANAVINKVVSGQLNLFRKESIFNLQGKSSLSKSDLYLSYNEYNLYQLPLSDTLTSLLKTSSYSKRTYTYTPKLYFKAAVLPEQWNSIETLGADNLTFLTNSSGLPLNERTFLEDLTLYSKYLKK